MSRNKLSAGVYEKWMGKEEYKKEAHRKEFVPDYIPAPPYVGEDVKYYPKDDMVFHKEEKEFFGAIEGIQLLSLIHI